VNEMDRTGPFENRGEEEFEKWVKKRVDDCDQINDDREEYENAH
jgi:hypothetical protein